MSASREENRMLFAGARAYSVVASLKARLEHEDGQALVEYALIISFIAVVAVGILVIMGGRVADLYSQMTDGL